MPTRTSHAVWKGDLKDGNGTLTVDDGVYEGPYSFASRFEDGDGTNPEELLAAAHAACFAMALSHELAQADYTPKQVKASAEAKLVEVDGGFAISEINLKAEGVVANISEADFLEYARGAKTNCPVSKALSGVGITLDATLKRPT